MKTTITKIINYATKMSLVDSLLEALAKKLDHAATALHELNEKLEDL
jgi:hypothetical protein